MDMFNMEDGHKSLVEGVGRVTCPVLILGVTSDVLFPIEQQREMAALFKEAGRLTIIVILVSVG
jgi:homoserine O-acetyltransferase